MTSHKIAFQLYSARMFGPVEPVLQALAEIGYDAVEAWAPNFEDPKGFRRSLDAVGLTCMGFHMPFAGLVNEPQRYIDIANILGDKPLMIPPFLAPADRPQDVDGWKRIGGQLAAGAEAAGAAGLKVAWHNHEYEFRMLPDGTRPIDHLLAEGSAAGFEIDLAWVLRGWADPKAEIERFASRITAIQIKDTAPPSTLDDENGWRAAGDGVVDWANVWPLFNKTPAEYVIVEHDRPVDWRRIAERSYRFTKSMGTTPVNVSEVQK